MASLTHLGIVTLIHTHPGPHGLHITNLVDNTKGWPHRQMTLQPMALWLPKGDSFVVSGVIDEAPNPARAPCIAALAARDAPSFGLACVATG